MTEFEYEIVQMAAGTRTAMFNERLEHLASEGWEPFLMSGDTTVNIMLRRRRKSTAPQQAQAAAAAAAPRSAAPVAQAPSVTPQPQAAVPQVPVSVSQAGPQQ